MTWILNSVHGARFNRTPSGWFDQTTFNDWFFTIALPYLKRKPGKKVLIGDNLASRISFSVIKSCEENNIHFILLPPNATHLLQPLDVAVFHPLKEAWRGVLQKWKNTNKLAQFKEGFPRLLKNTIDSVGVNGRSNMIAGFKATGLYPFSVKKGLSRLQPEPKTPRNSQIPRKQPRSDEQEKLMAAFTESLVKLLKKERFGDKSTPTAKGRKKKYKFHPVNQYLGSIWEKTSQQISQRM